MPKNYILLIGLLLICLVSSAQEENIENPPIQPSTIVPPSPTSASLGRYGEYEVSQSTGVPNISIPLHQIVEDTYNLPISLSYHASGIKVDDIGSWVGLGWSLNAGGIITRTVHGLPDEVNEPGVHEGYYRYGDWFQEMESFGEENYQKLKAASKNILDTEPDDFSINIGGITGSFRIKPLTANGITPGDEVILRPKQPIKIYPSISDNEIESFTVQGPDGTLYIFEENEKTDYRFNHQLSFVSTWHVTEIRPFSGGKIKFIYGKTHPVNYDLKRTLVKNYEMDNTGTLVQHGNEYSVSIQQVSIPFAKKLTRIEYALGSIDFEWLARSDKGAKLNKILVNNFIGQQVKEINFSYASFPVEDGGYARLKLTGVSINGENYNFRYDNTKFPDLSSPNQDHWGYYNGANNTTGIPTYTYNFVKQVGDGANRMPNADAMKMGILEEIKYPTGGVTKFEFEPNKYYNFDGKETVQNEWEYVHTHTGTAHSSSEYFSWPEPTIITPDPEIQIDPNNIKWTADEIYMEFGTVDDGFGMPEEYTDGSPFVSLNGTSFTNGTASSLGYDPMTGYHRKFHRTYSTINNIDLQLKTGTKEGNYVKVRIKATGEFDSQYPLNDDGHMLIGGLRIKSIKSYDANGDFIEGKAYAYDVKDNNIEEHPESSASMVIGSADIYSDNALPYVEAYKLEEGCWDPLTTNTVRYTLHDSPYGMFGQGSIIMYTKVKEFSIDQDWSSYNDNGLGSIVSTFDVKPDPGYSLYYPHTARMDNGTYRGQLLSKVFYDSEQVKQKEEKYYYSYTSYEMIKAAKIINDRSYYFDFEYNRNDAAGPDATPLGEKCGYNLYDMNQFKYLIYYYSSSFKHLDSATYVDYNDGIKLETKKYYDYNLEYQQAIREKFVMPDQTFIKETAYPFEWKDVTPVDEYSSKARSFLSNNVLNLPIEQRVYLENSSGQVLINSRLTKYSGSKPYQIFDAKIDNPKANFKRVEALEGIDNSYNTDNPDLTITHSGVNIVTQLGVDGIPTAYVWSYSKLYPVLKIVNLNYYTLKNELDSQGLDYLTSLETETGLFDVKIKTRDLREFIENNYPDSQVYSYAYYPEIGIQHIIDPNGVKTEYFYDDRNRLKTIQGPDGVLQSFQYKTINSKTFTITNPGL